jgi:hypothetical protein
VLQIAGVVAAGTFTAAEVSFVSHSLHLLLHSSPNLPNKDVNITNFQNYFSFEMAVFWAVERCSLG